MKKNTLLKSTLLLSCLFFLGYCAPVQRHNTARKQDFNKNWHFSLNDSITTSGKARILDLPHDWSIEGKFDEHSLAGIGGGALNGGVGWYRKTFVIPKEDHSKRISVIFDGVYWKSKVWVNGIVVGERPNGYISFSYDITPYLKFGQENDILVKVDNSRQPNSRWYSGSGIYRNVWLQKTNASHIAEHGTFITTPKITNEEATVDIRTEIDNKYGNSGPATLVTDIFFGTEKVASVSSSILLQKGLQNTIQSVHIQKPQLWSIETPHLYKAVSTIKTENKTVDEYETTFGIRSFKFDLDQGFILNGKRTKIKGVCLHHDLGALGSAFNTRAMERQLLIMKEMGVNGIRTSHNPPAPELLDLCDKMGFIVMDEAFDMWEKSKTEFDYSTFWADWHQKDLEDFIIRDRNHPSVFIWSIGNEIPEQWSARGAEIGRELSKIVKNLDTTRMVTAAMNPPVAVRADEASVQFQNTADKPNDLAGSGALDLIGYNYAHQTWSKHQINFPKVPFIAAETTSALQTRGYYDSVSTVLKKWPVRWDIPFYDGNPGNTVSAYDQTYTPWGSTHEESWKIIKKYDFLAGMYIWTGFDYIGEPTPYLWPSISSYFGIVDLAGFPKDVYYMYQSEWTNKDVLHLFPHWNWTRGKNVDVWAYYNNADEVELYLNGKSLGKQSKTNDDLHVMWRVKYEPGTLKAISRKNGKTVLEREIKTAGSSYQLQAYADRYTLKADGKDLSFITVEIQDDQNVRSPNARNEIFFSVKGNAKIVGVTSGDPTSHESMKGNSHTALNGKCLVIIQSTESPGTIEVSARAEGLKGKTITLTSK